MPPAVPARLVANSPVKLAAPVLKLSKAVAPIVNVLETAVAREPSEAVRVYMAVAGDRQGAEGRHAVDGGRADACCRRW